MERRQRKQRNRTRHYQDRISGVRNQHRESTKTTDSGDKDNISQIQTKAKEWIRIHKHKKIT